MTEFADEPVMVPRQLRPGQRAEVWISEVDNRVPKLAFSTDDVLLEAPNWAPDGDGLLLNGDGLLLASRPRARGRVERRADGRSAGDQQ